jgi:hypothetical protein
VSEAGLYRLILRSNKAEAAEFQEWVTAVVLPAIRKDGAYIKGEETAKSDDELMILGMQAMQRKIDRLIPQAKGMEPEAPSEHLELRDWLKEVSNLLKRPPTWSDRIKIGQRSATMGVVAGRPSIKAKRSVMSKYGTGVTTCVTLHSRAALERAAESIGLL